MYLSEIIAGIITCVFFGLFIYLGIIFAISTFNISPDIAYLSILVIVSPFYIGLIAWCSFGVYALSDFLLGSLIEKVIRITIKTIGCDKK